MTWIILYVFLPASVILSTTQNINIGKEYNKSVRISWIGCSLRSKFWFVIYRKPKPGMINAKINAEMVKYFGILLKSTSFKNIWFKINYYRKQVWCGIMPFPILNFLTSLLNSVNTDSSLFFLEKDFINWLGVW